MTELTTLNPLAEFDNPADVDVSTLNLPKVVGHNLLVLPLKLEGKTQGGIILTASTQQRMEEYTTCALVVDVGPMAYRHNDRHFKDPDTGAPIPWAKKGDWVIFSKIGAGTKIQYGGVRYWVIADTQILATVSDPSQAYPEFATGKFKLSFDQSDNQGVIPSAY